MNSLDALEEHASLMNDIKGDDALLKNLQSIVETVAKKMAEGSHLYLCGNGGSAADAQHIAGELSGRFMMDRDPLPAESLHSNSSFVTAVANDYSFDDIYARAIKAKGRQGDILIAISTSGHSSNILNAVKMAKKIGIYTIGFSGADGGELKNLVEKCICVPSSSTPRIQEIHILMGHILCDHVEKVIFTDNN